MPRGSGCGTNHSFTRPKPIAFDHQNPDADEVEISIPFCGIRRSDVHQSGDDRDEPIYPCIPRHGIAGRVSGTGASATGFKPGNLVGVDCMIDPCSTSSSCRNGGEPCSESSNSRLVTYDGATKPLGLAATGENLYAFTSAVTPPPSRYATSSCRASCTRCRLNAPPRFSAPVSPPTRRCGAGEWGRARASASSASAASTT